MSNVSNLDERSLAPTFGANLWRQPLAPTSAHGAAMSARLCLGTLHVRRDYVSQHPHSGVRRHLHALAHVEDVVAEAREGLDADHLRQDVLIYKNFGG